MSGQQPPTRCPVCGTEPVDWAKWLRDHGYTDADIDKLRSGRGSA